jgi:hypothetical protein
VGGGPLWIVLLAALTSKTNGNGAAAVLMASALISVLEYRDMLSGAGEADIRALISSIGIEDVKRNVIAKAPRMLDAMTALTRALTEYWESCTEAHRRGTRRSDAKSLLWSKRWGWKVLPPSPAQHYVNGYLDVMAIGRCASRHQRGGEPPMFGVRDVKSGRVTTHCCVNRPVRLTGTLRAEPRPRS